MLLDANDYTLQRYIGSQKRRYEFYAIWFGNEWLLVCHWGELQWSVNDFGVIISAIKGLNSHIDPKRCYWPALEVKRQEICSLPHPWNERQKSVTDFWSCIVDNHCAALQYEAIISVLAAFRCRITRDHIATSSSKWASTERQGFLVLHLE